MATIDVNIPDSALEAMAEKIAPHVEGRVNAVYRTTDKFEDLEVMVQDIESRLEETVLQSGDFKKLRSRVEALEELVARMAPLEKRLEDIVATLRQASDRINLGLTY